MAKLITETTDRRDVESSIKLLEAALAEMNGDVLDKAGPADEPDTALAEEMVTILWGRWGAKTQHIIKACAELAAEKGAFTLDDLAESLDAERSKIGRWKYNLGRSLKRIKREMPDAPNLFDQKWTGEHNLYTMRPEIIEAIRKLA